MDYTSIEFYNGDAIITGIRHFDLAQILDCGQAFRWSVQDCHCGLDPQSFLFTGIAHGRRLNLEISDDTLVLKNVTLAEFETTWKNYLDLERDYSHLRKMFDVDANLKKALEFSPGLRLMRQDAWEILISFILSQNSNIPRIKKMITLLCENFGQVLPCGGYAFPTPDALARLEESDLEPIRTGYRAPYIIDAARRVANGTLDLAALHTQSTCRVRNELLTVHGVGPKVAECVLLFGFGRIECFPLDVWMKRVMADMYPDGFPAGLAEYAGIAQQFLFHYARNGKIELLKHSIHNI